MKNKIISYNLNEFYFDFLLQKIHKKSPPFNEKNLNLFNRPKSAYIKKNIAINRLKNSNSNIFHKKNVNSQESVFSSFITVDGKTATFSKKI